MTRRACWRGALPISDTVGPEQSELRLPWEPLSKTTRPTIYLHLGWRGLGDQRLGFSAGTWVGPAGSRGVHLGCSTHTRLEGVPLLSCFCPPKSYLSTPLLKNSNILCPAARLIRPQHLGSRPQIPKQISQCRRGLELEAEDSGASQIFGANPGSAAYCLCGCSVAQLSHL